MGDESSSAGFGLLRRRNHVSIVENGRGSNQACDVGKDDELEGMPYECNVCQVLRLEDGAR